MRFFTFLCLWICVAGTVPAFAFDGTDAAQPLHASVGCMDRKIKASRYDSTADKCARTALKLAAKFESDWDAGNAVHKANLILGMIALQANDLDNASQFLLASAPASGSPQLDAFGPNMKLAQALLGKGVKAPVLKFFSMCGRFWKPDHGKLAQWSKDVSAERKPAFGANLEY